MISEIINYLVRFFGALIVAFGVAFGVYKAGKKNAENEAENNDLKQENKVLRSTLRLKRNEIKTAGAARDYINEQLRAKDSSN